MSMKKLGSFRKSIPDESNMFVNKRQQEGYAYTGCYYLG